MPSPCYTSKKKSVSYFLLTAFLATLPGLSFSDMSILGSYQPIYPSSLCHTLSETYFVRDGLCLSILQLPYSHFIFYLLLRPFQVGNKNALLKNYTHSMLSCFWVIVQLHLIIIAVFFLTCTFILQGYFVLLHCGALLG